MFLKEIIFKNSFKKRKKRKEKKRKEKETNKGEFLFLIYFN